MLKLWIEGDAVFLAPLKEQPVQSDHVPNLSFGDESLYSRALVFLGIHVPAPGHLKVHQGLTNYILISIKGNIHHKADIPPQTVQQISLGKQP